MKMRSWTNTAMLAFAAIVLSASIGRSADPCPRIVYVNSYHKGYGSSDAIMQGIRNGLGEQAIDLQVLFLNSKRQPDAEHVRERVAQVLKVLEERPPDVLIVSDDNAVKYVVVPHFKQGPFPSVFCGVNWSCEQYGLPTAYVTGMLEILPVKETVRVLQRYFPNSRQLVVLSEDTISEKSNCQALEPMCRSLGLTVRFVLVKSFGQWKEEFARANASADLVFLPTNGAVQDWDEKAATQFVEDHIRVPVFTCDDFMMPYAVFGLTKVASEQGEWAAKTALALLSGKSPADIPITRNVQTVGYLNLKLAEKVGFTPDATLRESWRVLK